jgi:hypothetical protein
MPDLNQDLPTRNELSWKALFAATEIEREMAKQLLDAGLCRDDDRHPYLVEIEQDPIGTAGDDSPLGAWIASIVAERPVELGRIEDLQPEHETQAQPAAPLLPEPSAPEPLGRSMQKLLRQEKPPEPPVKAKYYVAPKSGAAPTGDQMPISWESFDQNSPL